MRRILLVCSTDAQHEVIILAAFEAEAQSAHLLDEPPPDDQEMADVIARQEKFRRPVRLEEIVEVVVVGGDFVFIRVQDVKVAFCIEPLDHLVERRVGERVVMIQKGHELAGSERQTLVGGSRDAAIGGESAEFYTRVVPLELFGPAGKSRIGGAIVYQAKLPVLINLVENRMNAGIQEFERRPVERSDDTDERLIGESASVLLHFSHSGGRRSVARHPNLIGTL